MFPTILDQNAFGMRILPMHWIGRFSMEMADLPCMPDFERSTVLGNVVMTEIRFSRHAKRRMGLYDLSEGSIAKAIEHHIATSEDIGTGRIELVSRELRSMHDYPIKIVFLCEENSITVITAYPFRKGIRK